MKEKEFQEFKKNIPNYLNKLSILLKTELTYNYNDIDTVENFYVQNHKSPIILGLTETDFDNIFYAYFGEAIIYYNGGFWILSNSRKNRAYGTPIITNSNNSKYTISHYVWKEYIKRNLQREPISKIIRRSQIPRNI
jgi:hypothetical protein